MSLQVTVTGLPAAMSAVDPARYGRGLRDGMEAGGAILQEEAAAIIRPRRFLGTYEEKLRTRIRGSGLSMTARITTTAPGATSLSNGWLIGRPVGVKGMSGKAAGTAGLGPWAQARLGASPKEAPRMAFLIARSVKRRGYSPLTPRLRVFSRAWTAGSQLARAAIVDAIRRAR